MDVIQRMADKIHIDRVTGCWVWLGAKSEGYGKVRHEGRMQFTHRIAYETEVAPIQDGMQIDHLCRNRACCNPAHLEAVTSRVNTLRGTSRTAVNSRKTHCANGHEFNDSNTLTYRNERHCRACIRDRNEVRRTARHEAAERAGKPMGIACALRVACPHGHLYDAANTYMDTDGKRRCRTCIKASHRALVTK